MYVVPLPQIDKEGAYTFTFLVIRAPNTSFIQGVLGVSASDKARREGGGGQVEGSTMADHLHASLADAEARPVSSSSSAAAAPDRDPTATADAARATSSVVSAAAPPRTTHGGPSAARVSAPGGPSPPQPPHAPRSAASSDGPEASATPPPPSEPPSPEGASVGGGTVAPAAAPLAAADVQALFADLRPPGAAGVLALGARRLVEAVAAAVGGGGGGGGGSPAAPPSLPQTWDAEPERVVGEDEFVREVLAALRSVGASRRDVAGLVPSRGGAPRSTGPRPQQQRQPQQPPSQQPQPDDEASICHQLFRVAAAGTAALSLPALRELVAAVVPRATPDDLALLLAPAASADAPVDAAGFAALAHASALLRFRALHDAGRPVAPEQLLAEVSAYYEAKRQHQPQPPVAPPPPEAAAAAATAAAEVPPRTLHMDKTGEVGRAATRPRPFLPSPTSQTLAMEAEYCAMQQDVRRSAIDAAEAQCRRRLAFEAWGGWQAVGSPVRRGADDARLHLDLRVEEGRARRYAEAFERALRCETEQRARLALSEALAAAALLHAARGPAASVGLWRDTPVTLRHMHDRVAAPRRQRWAASAEPQPTLGSAGPDEEERLRSPLPGTGGPFRDPVGVFPLPLAGPSPARPVRSPLHSTSPAMQGHAGGVVGGGGGGLRLMRSPYAPCADDWEPLSPPQQPHQQKPGACVSPRRRPQVLPVGDNSGLASLSPAAVHSIVNHIQPYAQRRHARW